MWTVSMLPAIIIILGEIVHGTNIKLNATIYKFELSSKLSKDNFDKVEFGEKTIFRNNGSTKITQHYSRTMDILESYKIDENINQLERLHISTQESTTVKISTNFEPVSSHLLSGFGASAKATFANFTSTALRDAYLWKPLTQVLNKSEFIHEYEKEFTISKEIDVLPCSEYEVTSFVKILKQVPIEYWAYAKLIGTTDGRRMSALELRNSISDTLSFTENDDDWTVTVKWKGIMTATFGVEGVMRSRTIGNNNCLNGTQEREIPTDLVDENGRAWATHHQPTNSIYVVFWGYIVAGLIFAVMLVCMYRYTSIRKFLQKSYLPADKISKGSYREPMPTYNFKDPLGN